MSASPAAGAKSPSAPPLEGDKLAIEKRRQRDLEERSNAALAADLLGDAPTPGAAVSDTLSAAIKGGFHISSNICTRL